MPGHGNSEMVTLKKIISYDISVNMTSITSTDEDSMYVFIVYLYIYSVKILNYIGAILICI